MASLNDFKKNIANMIKDLDRTREKAALEMTFEALALVKRRVINTGEDAEGGSFGGYSKALVPFWFLASADGVSANDAAKLYNKFGYFASYHDLREIKQFKLFKNFSFTNKMWNALEPTVLKKEDDIITIFFSTPDQLGQSKIAWNTARDGNFLALNQFEIDLLTELNEDRFNNLLRKNNLS